MWCSLLSAASASANITQQKWVLWCQSVLAHVLAALPPVAVSGILPWLQHLSHSNFSFWPIWLDSPFYWPQVKFSEGKGEGGPEMREATLLCGAIAGLYSQVCNIHVAKWLQCLADCSIHVPYVFPAASPLLSCELRNHCRCGKLERTDVLS